MDRARGQHHQISRDPPLLWELNLEDWPVSAKSQETSAKSYKCSGSFLNEEAMRSHGTEQRLELGHPATLSQTSSSTSEPLFLSNKVGILVSPSWCTFAVLMSFLNRDHTWWVLGGPAVLGLELSALPLALNEAPEV